MFAGIADGVASGHSGLRHYWRCNPSRKFEKTMARFFILDWSRQISSGLAVFAIEALDKYSKLVYYMAR